MNVAVARGDLALRFRLLVARELLVQSDVDRLRADELALAVQRIAVEELRLVLVPAGHVGRAPGEPDGIARGIAGERGPRLHVHGLPGVALDLLELEIDAARLLPLAGVNEGVGVVR